MELTIYAIIAFFIFSRLYNAFGKSNQVTKKYIKLNTVQVETKIDNLQDNVQEEEEDKFKYVSSENITSILDVVQKIKLKEPKFSTDKFIEGAEKAFEIVLSSYSKGDLKTIKPLLSKSLFDNLSAKVEKYKNNGETLENTLISIETKKLIKLELLNSVIHANVKFVSEQINILKDKEGKVISGNSATEMIEDILEFKRTAGSSSPKWILSDMY
jgi:predicted lipid-binding transport protein (Tim44 family)